MLKLGDPLLKFRNALRGLLGCAPLVPPVHQGNDVFEGEHPGLTSINVLASTPYCISRLDNGDLLVIQTYRMSPGTAEKLALDQLAMARYGVADEALGAIERGTRP